KSHAARIERLKAAGVDDGAINRIDAPVGLDIGAIGPAEIALSIAAAMVKAFHALGDG
ncbi:XdhC family protein, partial [Acinetobacter baumannii]